MADVIGATWNINPSTNGLLYMEDVTGPAASAELLVFPFTTPSIFDDWTDLDNQGATWKVDFEEPLDGTFEYFDGGGFLYTRGNDTGTAFFDYTVINYDGFGSNDSARVSVLVE